MKPGSSPLKRASAASARVVDIALRQEDRFGRLADAASAACPHARAGSPASSCASSVMTMPQTTKKPAAKVATGPYGLAGRRSFSDLFNVAASRPAKSPRDKMPLDPSAGLRQLRRSLNHWSSAAWPEKSWPYRMETRPFAPDRHPSRHRDRGAVRSPARWPTPRPLDADQIQPASLDLRLGEKAWRVRASFLPGPAHTVAGQARAAAAARDRPCRRRGA